MHRYGTAGLLGLALLGTTGAALAADIPGNARTKAVITPGPARFEGVLEKRGDSDWYRITLKAGRNYAFEVHSWGCTRMNLRNTAGKVLRSDVGWDDEDGGFEFRSATTKTYFVEYVDANKAPCIDPVVGGYPTEYSGNVAIDVRGDPTTQTTIAPGQEVESLLNWYSDRDYFRATLEAGKGYVVSVSSDNGGARLFVVDRRGNVVAGEASDPEETLSFKVPKTGTYYVVVLGDGYSYGQWPYTVSLSTP
jgi:serralysin